jgi:hypothetical protein
VDNYTAIFHKQERVKGKLLPPEKMLFKFKRPFQIYMKWIGEEHEGREVLYVQGRNENRIKGHEGGILGVVTLNLDPNGARAMKGNRHPITDSGLDFLVDKLASNVRLGLENSELQVRDHGLEPVYGRNTRVYEGIFAKKPNVYYCYRALVNIDEDLGVPVKVRIFDTENQLIEMYGYENLKLEAGLSAADFDPDNPQYRF